MTTYRLFISALATLCALGLASCGNQKPAATATTPEKQPFVNPYPAGTYDHFKADPSYPKTHSVWKNQELLSRTDASNSWIKASLSSQRAFLMNNDEVVMDYPICTGVKNHPTPTGTFYILEKVVDKKSNRYGKILNASGGVVNSDADSLKDPIPEGGSFAGAPMRYWMRLTNDGIGHHIGPVRRYRASHGCIRGPSATVPVVYSKVKVGTRVVVE